MQEPVTVLICCYNEGELLNRAINSIKRQNAHNLEIIIVNDFSTDVVTNKICNNLEKEDNIQIIWHKKNTGLSGARNSGFNNANTNIIIPLDADDELPDGAIDAILNTFEQNTDTDFVFGNYIKIDDKGNSETVNCAQISTSEGKLDPFSISKEWKLLGTSPCRKSLWEKIGGYDLKFSIAIQDIDFWIRAIMSGAKGIYINKNIYTWCTHNSGMNNNVQPIYHIYNLEKNIAFFIKYNAFPNIKDANSFIFLNYYGNEYYSNAVLFGLRNFFQISSYCKIRLMVATLRFLLKQYRLH